MPGMGGIPLSTSNSTIVTAFQLRLLHQLLLVLVILAVLAIAWNLLRSAQLRRALDGAPQTRSSESNALAPEPVARRVLRVGFGLLWIFDGVLQAQAAMPVGLADHIITPAAATSPSWVQHLVASGATIWNNHPIEAATASVWIQLGIGAWLLVAPRGRWSRWSGLASLAWGLLVWSFGEAFGQIFAPGASWLFGAPGAVLFYCLAGALLALPEPSWSSARLGRAVLFAVGLFFIGMALLQAWPGRGFWQGHERGQASGTLVAMVRSMSATAQPKLLSDWVGAFASFDAAHGFAVNLFVVIALGAIGLGVCSLRRSVVRVAVVIGVLFCLADWILVEDLGFLGGLGTDPNSMIPMALVFVAGYLAMTRPGTAAAPAAAPAGSWLERAQLQPAHAFRSLAALGAVLVTLLGAAPMALASVNSHADPIIAEATDGTPQASDSPAAGFRLTDQYGRSISLAGLKGKSVVLSFLDPVCTTDCPIIAQELRQADQQLGARSADTEFVAVVANPLYRGLLYTRAFDAEQGLGQLKNWLYLTGSERALAAVWNAYGVQVEVAPAGSMVDHSDIVYLIDAAGKLRSIMDANPGAGSTTSKSSFSDLLVGQLDSLASS